MPEDLGAASLPRVLRLWVEYAGGGFAGWQAQPGARTVQGELERALTVALRAPAQVNGASRTDAGVHALGQAASLETTSDLPTSKLQRAVNALLPDDVSVTAIDEVAPGFHARFAARGKHYRYRILCRAARSPLEAATAWHLPRPLDLEAMQAAADRLVGRHDFTALVGRASATDPSPAERDCVRTISMVQVGRQPLGVVAVTPGRLDAPACSVAAPLPVVTIDVVGDGFLYKMVRTIAGTLAQVGEGRLVPGDLDAVLASGDRRSAGPTAPPHGLFLVRVVYDDAPLAVATVPRGDRAEGVVREGDDHGPAHDGPRLGEDLRGAEGAEARALLRSAP